MCLILFAQGVHPRLPLVVAANRDEFHSRPALPAEFWPAEPHLLMGKDAEAGGSWLGVNKSGQFAAVTNNGSVPAPTHPDLRSRGELVLNYLQKSTGSLPYARQVEHMGAQYQGFNLLVGDAAGLCFTTNSGQGTSRLAPGLYGLANRALDDDCPRVQRGKVLLTEILQQEVDTSDLITDLLALLADPVPDSASLDASNTTTPTQPRSCFISGEVYGTRASTVLIITEAGQVEFVEQTWLAGGVKGTQQAFSFQLD